ncbi:hypothetical protein DB31_7106 [Hyalangium minutum]|uniref:Uncharacterized protein n=1 Tax=Hyalangium minutum TaxID=394096 RepID=A0A085WNE1_9BACT|nr:hypothetical protein DB31_7106 [Hyalangium minutum]
MGQARWLSTPHGRGDVFNTLRGLHIDLRNPMDCPANTDHPSPLRRP